LDFDPDPEAPGTFALTVAQSLALAFLRRQSHLSQVAEPGLRPHQFVRANDPSVAIVIVLIPITLGAPAMLVLVPPLMSFAPATLPGLVQFAAFVICLGAVAAMFPDGFVKLMIGMSHPPLAPVVIFSVKSWDRGEQQSTCHYRP